MNRTKRSVFITGGTGYVGSRLIARLLAGGHNVRGLARAGSEKKLPAGCEAVLGNALDASTYVDRIAPSDTFVQLVGVAHPSPAKGAQFRSVDRPSALGAVSAASKAGIQNFVYVSVAHPAPVMKAYIEVRVECERAVEQARLNATILRPWYVLGPGHYWPYLLLPAYKVMELLPSTREAATRLGLVTLEQMVTALADAVENPCVGLRVWGVPEIRNSGYAVRALAAKTS